MTLHRYVAHLGFDRTADVDLDGIETVLAGDVSQAGVEHYRVSRAMASDTDQDDTTVESYLHLDEQCPGCETGQFAPDPGARLRERIDAIYGYATCGEIRTALKAAMAEFDRAPAGGS